MKYKDCDLGAPHQVCDICESISSLCPLVPPMGSRDSRDTLFACVDCHEKIFNQLDTPEKLKRLTITVREFHTQKKKRDKTIVSLSDTEALLIQCSICSWWVEIDPRSVQGILELTDEHHCVREGK